MTPSTSERSILHYDTSGVLIGILPVKRFNRFALHAMLRALRTLAMSDVRSKNFLCLA